MDIFDANMGSMEENWEENLSSPTNEKLESFLSLYKHRLSNDDIELATKALNGQATQEEAEKFNSLVDKLEGGENVVNFPNKNQTVADNLNVAQDSSFREVFAPPQSSQVQRNVQSQASSEAISQNNQTDTLIKFGLCVFIAYMIYVKFFKDKE